MVRHFYLDFRENLLKTVEKEDQHNIIHIFNRLFWHQIENGSEDELIKTTITTKMLGEG